MLELLWKMNFDEHLSKEEINMNYYYLSVLFDLGLLVSTSSSYDTFHYAINNDKYHLFMFLARYHIKQTREYFNLYDVEFEKDNLIDLMDTKWPEKREEFEKFIYSL